jgi:hypothetical protein
MDERIIEVFREIGVQLKRIADSMEKKVKEERDAEWRKQAWKEWP